jgi:hypothetical protein
MLNQWELRCAIYETIRGIWQTHCGGGWAISKIQLFSQFDKLSKVYHISARHAPGFASSLEDRARASYLSWPAT